MSFPSSAANGTQAATISTEHTLATISTPGSYILEVDTGNMVNADAVELRVYDKVLSTSTITLGGVAGQYLMMPFCNKQADQVKKSIPFSCLYSSTLTLKQTAGTGRNFDWNIKQIA